MPTLLPLFLAMIAAIVLLNMLAAKLRIAYPVLLVVAGLMIGFIPGLPQIRINPDLIFFVFLPPLLFFSAWSVSFKEMRKWWRMISSFAFLVVFVTAFTVAVVANHFIPGFSIALGFLLGGIVSPPDAVSTAAITRFVRIPRVLSSVLEGESLMNDASSLIIFRFALVTIGTGQFIWQQAALNFLWMVLGGAAVGLLLAWIFVQVHKRLPTDAPSDIAFTLIEPYFMYWAAEQLHCSGVLAVVCGGLFMSGQYLVFLNSTSRIRAFSVWESLSFILNGIVFFMIGLDLPEIVHGLRTENVSLGEATGYGLLVTIVLIATRIVCCYAAQLATFVFRRRLLPAKMPKKAYWIPLVMGWTGMRGVVSLAAALSIPVLLANGNAFPQRHLVLFITFVVILLTLLVQGLTLPYLINRSKAFSEFVEPSEEGQTKKIKAALKAEIYRFLKTKYENGHFRNNIAIEKMMRHWEEKSDAADDNWMNEESKAVFREMLQVQRKYLSELNKDPDLNEELIRGQLYQIDLEEERLRIL